MPHRPPGLSRRHRTRCRVHTSFMVRAGINNAMQTQRLIEFMQRAMPPMATLPMAAGAAAGADRRRRRPAPASVARSRRIASSRTVSFDLGEVRRIKSVVDGATVNDAVLAVVAGAMRRYLWSRTSCRDPLVVMAPISIRSADEKSAGAGNRVSGMTPLDRRRGRPARAVAHRPHDDAGEQGDGDAVPARIADFNQFVPGR